MDSLNFDLEREEKAFDEGEARSNAIEEEKEYCAECLLLGEEPEGQTFEDVFQAVSECSEMPELMREALSEFRTYNPSLPHFITKMMLKMEEHLMDVADVAATELVSGREAA